MYITLLPDVCVCVCVCAWVGWYTRAYVRDGTPYVRRAPSITVADPNLHFTTDRTIVASLFAPPRPLPSFSSSFCCAFPSILLAPLLYVFLGGGGGGGADASSIRMLLAAQITITFPRSQRARTEMRPHRDASMNAQVRMAAHEKLTMESIRPMRIVSLL